MKKTRVKNGKKQPSAKSRGITYLEKKKGMTKAQAEAFYKKEFRTFSAKTRNYKKVAGSKAEASELFLKKLKYGTSDDLIREIEKMPTTNPKVSKEKAGGDLERYSKTTISKSVYPAANAYYLSFIVALYTAGPGSNLRRIWNEFVTAVTKDTYKKADEAQKAVAGFWNTIDSSGGLVPADAGLPTDWIISQKNLKKLVSDISEWSEDYQAANKGGKGAGADSNRRQVSATSGS